ncbi:MAG: M24 family metallopeptidase [Solirubrobacterales bacterium]
MQAAALLLGADAIGHIQLQAGVHSTVAMAASLSRPAAPGEIVHVDFGAVFAGYPTDLARNAAVTAAAPAQLDIYRRLADIQLTLIDAVRPGVTAAQLAHLNSECLDSAGLRHPFGSSVVGHSTGLAIHEGFAIAEGAEVELQPGMLINLEPTHIEPGDARYHIEDTLLVTETGSEVLGGESRCPDLGLIAG